ncbi:MAG TPA: hypothetical protein VNV88_06825 [Candidatus Solibacter sp.]|jgi:hypothetical protein|nr:hypothetical protein [Candidatus Solibacter sp.]
MSLGAVLIRPQPLAAPPASISPSDVLMAFVESLLKDPTMTLPALKSMGEEASKFLVDTIAGIQEPVRLSNGKVRAVFQPFIDPVNLLVDGLSGDVASVIPAVLQALLKLLEQLTTDKVVELFGKLLDFVQKDLGISGTKLRNLLTDLTTRMIEALQQRAVNGESSKEAIALYDFGVALDDIQILLDRDIPFPALDTQKLLDEIRKIWASFDLDRIIALVRAILERGEEVIEPFIAIAQAIAEINISVSPIHSFAPQGPLKNRFMAANGTSGNPTPPASSDPIAWYASWVAGKTVRGSQAEETELKGLTFGQTLTKERMEQIAFHSAWILPLLEGILFHATSAEEGDVGNNIMMLLENLTQMGVVAFKKEDVPLWVRWPMIGVMPWIGTLESGLRGCWWYHLIADTVENLMYRTWSWELRELLLSSLTLVNDDGVWLQQENPPEDATLHHNAHYLQGVCHATIEIGNLLFFGFYRNRSEYFASSDSQIPPIYRDMFWLPQVWALGTSFLSFVPVAILLGKADLPARVNVRFLRAWLGERMLGRYSFEDGSWIGKTVSKMVATYVLYAARFLAYHFMFTEGATDGGTLAMDGNGNSVQGDLKFLGYPDPQKSPYLMPWEGAGRMCVQGNMGVISHNAQGGQGQIYAVDFELGLGQEILASRAGIVFNIDDTQPRGQSWNFVEIMHLIVVPPGGTAPPGVTASAIGAPSSITTFNDGTTPIPANTLFPPYWDKNGNATLPFGVPLHPSGCILPVGWTAPASAPYYQGFNGFPAGTTFAFLLPGQDRGLGGDPGQMIPGGSATGGFATIQATFATYGHGQQNFMTQKAPVPGGSKPLFHSGSTLSSFPSEKTIKGNWSNTVEYQPGDVVSFTDGKAYIALRAGTGNPPNIDLGNPISFWGLFVDLRNRVLGQFVQQGQVIMLADSTGKSSFNHVHMQVSGLSGGTGGSVSGAPWPISAGGGANWSIPFVFQDIKRSISHGIFKAIVLSDGIPKVFTTYSPTVPRVPPE